ncbi:transposase [Enterocloster citroniae]|uniref:Transposase n=2 Tax=Enterocloster citroniae TaxID=358743 RepID=A0ABV2G4I3_9FIRM
MYRQYSNQSTSAKCGCKKGAVNSENRQFIGVSRGGKTTKIHAIVDALGNPVHFMLTGGHVHDGSIAIDLLSGVEITGSNILADKAYGAQQIREYIEEKNARYTIPPKENCVEPWPCDYVIYKERHLVECFFNKIKAFRRVATQYDKLAVSFLGFVHLASIWILLK